MLSFFRDGMLAFVLVFVAFLVACGGSSTGDDGNSNNSANNQSDNQAANDNRDSRAGEEEGIDLPELVLEEGAFVVEGKSIMESIAKMNIEWTIEEDASYKLNYEWLGEREVDGELVDHFTLEFEDVSKGNSFVLEGEMSDNDPSYPEYIEYEEEGPTADDYDASFVYYAFTHWTFLFEYFNSYRSFLKDGDIPLVDYKTETETLGSSEVDVHYLTLGEGSGFVGLGFGGEQLKLAVIDDLELLLGIKAEDNDKLTVEVHALETR